MIYDITIDLRIDKTKHHTVPCLVCHVSNIKSMLAQIRCPTHDDSYGYVEALLHRAWRNRKIRGYRFFEADSRFMASFGLCRTHGSCALATLEEVYELFRKLLD